MEIDKKTIKALSADTRVNILKSLKERRKLPSELSKELKLSAPTVIEHLKKLEDAQLIKKQKRGAKWVYYELTKKGSNVIKPKISTQFVLVLSVGLMMIIGGVLNLIDFISTPLFGKISQTAAAEAIETTVGEAVVETPAYEINWLALIIIIIGIILISYSLVKLIRK